MPIRLDLAASAGRCTGGELEIARALDRIREVTVLDPRHVRASWAGLRSFAPDRSPVAGYDTEVEGFFWLAGQGGYGIQTAPALARAAAALVDGRPLPTDLAARELTARDLSRARLDELTPVDHPAR
jgi:D-arginine dehydrogenase